ncbi:glycerol-3-phosphate dehydrogenase [Fulvimarina sp. 2208YS6-2-32]|uniref:Glycerol-3-phosphate dehydrogenase n=1 Tax=Fulvimarina uroteuthidis TaxID=3098149 RepID=A0ABU5I3X0_9HYPH|nr:glycerol-3-phosphate dehydrogenase [Fulvimarina sp. 2208YS6-2-32]MDY8109463.1 glycerol-3-phosphate dehydrogenase [Fulvimarina sp. 2208YS6-2-32]
MPAGRGLRFRVRFRCGWEALLDYDVFIVGGGINGCGIARDAAGRGYSVGLAEMNDLASGTSSWSTKLIHGGLRYLEHYEFNLVRHALKERETLWAIAPHIIRPLRFILPHHKGLRPAFILRIGLFLYDHIGGRKKLKKTVSLDLSSGPLGAPLKDDFSKGFEYSDARVDDARLVVLNARDASGRGADIMVRTKVTEARRENGVWHVTLEDRDAGTRRTVTARSLVNMGGPWVDEIIRGTMGRNEANHIRLVQGSHLVTRKLYDHDRAYIFQNADGRIIFTIPYEDDFTLVGTTDQDYDGDPADVKITESETDYLLAAASEYLKTTLTRDDIVWTYSGVRPLFDDGASKAQETTRDYVLTLEGNPDEAPLVNGFGGKITTYRVLSEEVVEMIEARIGAKGQAWTDEKPLPGGDFPVDGVAALEAELRASAPELDEKTVRRLVRSYGTDAKHFAKAGKMGENFGHGLFAAEIDWMIDREWARSAEDVLWRRSKLGLRFSEEETRAVEDHVSHKTESMTAAA